MLANFKVETPGEALKKNYAKYKRQIKHQTRGRDVDLENAETTASGTEGSGTERENATTTATENE